MRKNFVRKTVILATVLALAAPAYPAVAGGGKGKGKGATKTAVTKMDLVLEAQELSAGGSVSGTVKLTSRTGKTWTAAPAAAIEITYDGEPAATVVTDASGAGTFSFSAGDEGEHVVKATFAGNSTLKRSQRSQGVTVLAVVVPDPPVEDELVEATP